MRALDQRQLATIVAALRFFQRNYDEDGLPPIAVREIATDCGEVTPLTPDEVDALAEDFNTTVHADPTSVTLVALTNMKGELEMSGYVREEDAWDAIGAYAAEHWHQWLSAPMPDDPRERADAFFAAREVDYEVATVDLRWAPKDYSNAL